jgi:Flp pilus assembly protein TadG
MHRLELKLSNRKGFTLILSALLIFVFLGAAVMAVDVGHMQLRRADVHAASDAAALAAIEKFYATSGCAGLTCRADGAKAEALTFAGKFKADASPLTVDTAADVAMGHWGGGVFTAGGSDTNAAQVTVRYVGSYTFAPALFGNIGSHTASATSVAVGVGGKTVTQSTCVSPIVLPYADLATQLGIASTTDLSQTDLNTLANATAGTVKLDTLSIPNGTKVNSNAPNQWTQINVPPAITPAGQPANPGPPSTADFRNAFTCTGNPNTEMGIDGWYQPINGTKANATPTAIDAIAPGGSPPVTLLVLVADQFAQPAGCPTGPGAGGTNGCFHVKYLASFTVTGFTGNGSNTSVIGYFSIAPVNGGIVGTDNSVGPVEKIRTRLAQ